MAGGATPKRVKMPSLDDWFGAATPVCRECGYSLTGLGVTAAGDAARQCPECGTALERSQVAMLRDPPGVWMWALCVWGPGVVTSACAVALDRFGIDALVGGPLLAITFASIGMWFGVPAWYAREFVSPPRLAGAAIRMAVSAVIGNLILCVLVVNAAREL